MTQLSASKLWRKQKKLVTRIGVTGTIENFTVIHSAPAGFQKQAPYPVVYVETTNGQKVIGQLVDYDEKDLKIGRKVISVIRRSPQGDEKDAIEYLIKFKPVWEK